MENENRRNLNEGWALWKGAATNNDEKCNRKLPIYPNLGISPLLEDFMKVSNYFKKRVGSGKRQDRQRIRQIVFVLKSILHFSFESKARFNQPLKIYFGKFKNFSI
jgi:hypothetical protein